MAGGCVLLRVLCVHGDIPARNYDLWDYFHYT